MARVFTIAEGLENLGALHTGGQGSVYKAKRTGTLITAVKILPTPILHETTEDKAFAAFQNEVAKLQKVNEHPCPHVVRILGSGISETGAFPYIEMEFIEGPDLEALLQPPHDPVFTIAETAKVAEHLAQALAHCHKAGVKHADVKSNNVKYNVHSGNYVLLDFGLSIMSDEQRRTSLRHAGAIEFMAPEQHQGTLLFESDVYSYGVVLFELLAGQVPFPLHDKSESARNHVMVAHGEEPLPDLLALRRQHLPEHWSAEQKEAEMNVPQWLLQLVHRCLAKAPAQRFANGVALRDDLLQQKRGTAPTVVGPSLIALREENKRLLEERAALQQALSDRRPRGAKSKRGWLLPLLFLLGGTALGFGAVSLLGGRKGGEVQETENATGPVKPRNSIGQYMVVASRAYFHSAPDEATRRKAFMIPSNDVVSALQERNGFVYTEFTNSRGQKSKGWLKLADLTPLAQWSKKGEGPEVRLRPEDVALQLQEARGLMARNKVKEAVFIYSYLARQQVPEAMYQYGNGALQSKHREIDCKEALEWMGKASERGYAPAKTTLGFLYLFANNASLLEMNEYGGCKLERNVYKGTRLLTQAAALGDSTAGKLVQQLKLPLSDTAR